ncbi:bifunctional DedA family/phosphatase PAP2 family protein [Luteimonas sp. S4-F44]|uniref:bifunctional DedA family/phosphatase PAP2 family protein n=1 Tax=Luteimonas sp. S4-F44 TaxID=2925842 RepID=UPI001F539465|nr:bifunctional DedA family/phosphatase PAP2 family protein [Luteimonas sp. S4-F44]UNK42279.1 bifunctional DedA family/phosphatase PAP2 family protein [Luteimonas sp. S4-F44]
MLSEFFNSLIGWVGDHPVAAGIVVFLIAFCDSVIVLGAIVPALPLLFAIGVLIGLGEISGPYAVACATLGAMAGDGLSYWVGRRWGHGLRTVWPFHKFPQLLDRGENLFRRNAVKSILIARYVGAIRPFVPAIAGIAKMPLRRYLPVSGVACLSWGALFLAPGWLFGASYDAVAAVADRLAIVLGALVAVLALAWAIVLYTYRWFDAHANSLLARLLGWTRQHPRLGRYAVALVDPRRPESASLAILAVCLLAIGWAWFALLATVIMRGEPLLLDQTVFQFMYELRNPLADRLMAGLASIGDVHVLGPAVALTLGWLIWRRRWLGAAHWLAALAFGMALTALLGAVIDMPRPPTAHGGFGFPAVEITMATIVFGFFAVLIARELPGRSRVWPYLVSGAVVAVLGFARLYLGAHWLSDIVGGMLLGIVWLLVLGIAYRRHVDRSFWMRPVATIFYVTFVLAALWHAPRAVDPLLARLVAAPPARTLAVGDWWARDWAQLPGQLRERDPAHRWPLDLQVAGPLAPLQARLQAQGWQVQPQADWMQVLNLLDDDVPADDKPVLPATLDANAESLLMRRVTDESRIEVLRLWRAPVQLDDAQPLWLGTSQSMLQTRPFGLFSLWQPQPDAHGVHRGLRDVLTGFEWREDVHPQSGVPTLRLRIAGDGSVVDQPQ